VPLLGKFMHSRSFVPSTFTAGITPITEKLGLAFSDSAKALAIFRDLSQLEGCEG
jgi:hypothetical protein